MLTESRRRVTFRREFSRPINSEGLDMIKSYAMVLCFISIITGASMDQTERQSTATSNQPGVSADQQRGLVLGLRGVRYQVKDVKRSVNFYTQQLGFKLDMENLPAFAQVSVGNLQLILSGPGASGSRPLPDGRRQEPGGFNRIILQVKDLPATIEALKKAGLHFRNEMEVGPGGKQIQLEDPDLNPIELFEPAG
jgi:glyoxylase I family protein